MRDDVPCQAGRLADFGGKWLTPCPALAEEALAFSEDVGLPRVSGTPVLMLCGAHMTELMVAGMIDEPNVGVAEWIARLDEPVYSCHACGTPVAMCIPAPHRCCDGCHHGGAMRHRDFAPWAGSPEEGADDGA